MRVNRVVLEDFRSYPSLDLRLSERHTLLVGANGAGKTNLLEALAFLALGTSPRTTDDADVVRWGAPLARIRAEVERAEGSRRLEAIVFAPAEGERRRPKRFFLDGAPKRAVDLAGELRIVAFFPDEMDLLTDAPAARRRYLDGVIGQMDRRYRRNLTDLARVVDQRNALLRAARDDSLPPRPDEMAFWDAELARLGAEVAAARMSVVEELAPHFQRAHETLAGASEVVIGYACQVRPGTLEEIAESYGALLREKRERELWQGGTLVGPQRDDLTVSSGGRPLPSFASRGEHRTAILALKLAQASWITERVAEPPLFLLDDVLSELDAERRGRLAGAVPQEAQCLMTAAVPAGLPERLVREAGWLRVAPGSVSAAPAGKADAIDR
jgi:DNA replication and repair protein RecF